jgi:TetR/AcrR family transcriptional repressor of nem operon
MKVSRKQAESNRAAIVESAARLFREQGMIATGVAQVTHDAGLTHGGFYGQFPTGKEGLAAEAITRAFEKRRNDWKTMAAGLSNQQAVEAIVDTYLSDAHLCEMGEGCPVPALAADVARASAPIRAAFTDGVRDLIDILARKVRGHTTDERQAEAARQLATLAGAILLARSVDDPALAKLVLDAVRGAEEIGCVSPDYSHRLIAAQT